MTLTELRYITALAQQRHFGRAAEATFVSQPTLSVAVKKLEEELGVTLFERGTHEVTLTPIGAQIVEQAQRVLEQVAAIAEIAKHGKDPLVGALRLGLIYTISPYLLPLLIPQLQKKAPQMSLLIQENYTTRLLEMLKMGELDVIIIASEVNEPGLIEQALYDETFVVAMPQGHRWAKRKSITAADLAEESLLLLGSGHCFRDQVLKFCPALNRTAAAPGSMQKNLAGSSLETMRHMVASGIGITVLPSTSVPHFSEKAHQNPNHLDSMLAYRPFAKPAPDRRVILVWRSSFPRLAAVEVLRQAILNCPLQGVKKLRFVST